jgi:hypothetical protein
MAVGHEKASAIRLQGELKARRDVEGGGRRVLDRELAKVGDHSKAAWAVHAINPHDVASADIGSDEGHQHVRCPAEELDIDRAADSDDGGRQAGGVCRDVPRLWIDAKDAAGCTFRHVERPAGADGTT